LLDLQKFDVESKGSEQSDREKTTKRNERKKDYVIVESKHNYPPNWDFEKEISIPVSSHLLVTFDPKCATEDSQDILQLYCVENGEKKPVLDGFSGKAGNFPAIPVVIPSDTVFFEFHSSPFVTYWGFRCIITGVFLLEYNLLYELTRINQLLYCKIIESLIVGKKNEDQHFMKWIDSDIFDESNNSTTTPSNEENVKNEEKKYFEEISKDGNETFKKLIFIFFAYN